MDLLSIILFPVVMVMSALSLCVENLTALESRFVIT
jgi:hypothetical protein